MRQFPVPHHLTGDNHGCPRAVLPHIVLYQIVYSADLQCIAIIQHDMDLKRSTYEVLQILSISLTDKTHLRDLFDKTNFNDVKEQFVPLIPGVFN